jgi:c-di-GMP-binding flagellar brake protein YcgR
MINKRRFSRVLQHAELTWRLVNDTKQSGSISKDISAGGLRFFVTKFIPPKSNLRIQATIPDAHLFFEIIGEVKWTRTVYSDEQYEIGVEFTDIPEDALKKLNHYITIKSGNVDTILAEDKRRERPEKA